MTLPTFVGIGVQRAGTTWLHELLASHPDVYVPTRRKEVHFFDWHYERGLQWYEKFFPPGRQASRYQAIGEITPNYWFCPHCPERIASVPSITKLILILRNPIDRLYSNYVKRMRDWNYPGSFEDYASTEYYAQKSRYCQTLRKYLRYFSTDQILVLIFEHAVADVPKTKETLARFLDVAGDRFPLTVGVRKVNRSYIPKARSAHVLSMKVARELRKWDLDGVVNFVKRFDIERLFGEADMPPLMKAEARDSLYKLYEDDIRELESLLQVDLSYWK